MQDSIQVDGQTFIQVTTTTKGGKVLSEVYFSADNSKVKVEIDYRYSDKGHK